MKLQKHSSYFYEFCKTLFHASLHFFYPSYCLACRQAIEPNSLVLCKMCAAALAWIDPQERCMRCFSHKKQQRHCLACQAFPNPFCRIGAAFEYTEPIISLMKHFKYGNKPYLAKALGAALVLQMERLKWPLPEIIIPVPLSFPRKWERGYNQSTLLAQEMSKLLKIPIYEILKRKIGGVSQKQLPLTQRLMLQKEIFYLKSTEPLKDKKVLIVDDVLTSGATLRCCGEILCEGYPASLYGIVVAHNA